MDDKTNPGHYKFGSLEAIDLIENLSFNRGSAVKYLVRSGRKPGEPEMDDLKKAEWFIQREIKRLMRGGSK